MEFNFSRKARYFFLLFIIVAITFIPFAYLTLTDDSIFLGLAVVTMTLTVIMCFLCLTRPFVTVSKDGLRFNPAIMIKFLPWESISRFEEVEEPTPLGKTAGGFAIHRSDGKGLIPVIRINSMNVERLDEFSELIRESLREHGTISEEPVSNHNIFSKALAEHAPVAPLRYKGLSFSSDGIVKGYTSYSWKRATHVEYPSGVISGYGATSISFRNEGGPSGSDIIVIPAGLNERYRDAVRFVAHYAKNAHISESIMEVFRTSPLQAKMGSISLAISLIAIVSFVAFPISIFRFGLHEQEYVLSGILAASAGGLFLAWLITLTVMKKNKSVALVFSFATLVASVASSVGVFTATPASFNLMKGMYHETLRSYDNARNEYSMAVELSDSIDAHHDLARVELRRGRYREAFEHMSLAYEREPLYWGPRELSIITNSLKKMGKADDMRAWCDRLIKEQAEEDWVLKGVRKNCGRK